MEPSLTQGTSLPLKKIFAEMIKNIFVSLSRRIPLTKEKHSSVHTMQTPSLSFVHAPSNGSFSSQGYSRSRFSGLRKNIQKNYFFYIPLGIFALIVIFLFLSAAKNTGTPSPATTLGDSRVNIGGPLATQNIDKTFLFPLKDSTGKTVTSLKYYIDNAELRDKIILQGKPYDIVKGKHFLILNLKITNDYGQKVQMHARDYVRLVVNGSSEKLAPDIHNDPLELQPISTKLTRLGFTVFDTDRNFELQVGEINGKKETIKLVLR